MDTNNKVIIVSIGHMGFSHLPTILKHFSLFIFGVEERMVDLITFIENSSQTNKAHLAFFFVFEIIWNFGEDSERDLKIAPIIYTPTFVC